jgi:hypothetical protein
MTPITPTDDIIGPVIHQLSTFLSTYVVGIGRIYEQPPDGPPENNSVMLPVTSIKYEYSDVGKVRLKVTMPIWYMIRRTKFSDNIAQAYKMYSAIVRVLTAWPLNQLPDVNGNDLAIEVLPQSTGFIQTTVAGQAYIALLINTEIITEFSPIYQ